MITTHTKGLTLSNENAYGPEPVTGVVQPLVENPPVGTFKEADPARVQILREAAQLIVGQRQEDYGTPKENFARIAALWNIQLAHLLGEGKKFEAHDVALAMVQLKLARLIQTPTEDSFKDAAGYIAIAWETSLDRD